MSTDHKTNVLAVMDAIANGIHTPNEGEVQIAAGHPRTEKLRAALAAFRGEA